MEQSPHLEFFKSRDWEVLLLDDPVDEFVVDSLHQYKDKHLKAVDKGGLDQADIAEDRKKEFQPLLDYFKEKLADIKEARLSQRLKESAVCLVADEGSMSAHMERLMQRLHRDQQMPASKRILEINAEHPVIRALLQLVGSDRNDPRLEKNVRLLYDEAILTEGSKIKAPLEFVNRINELLLRELS
jgi:molecular chaperone HtpG